MFFESIKHKLQLHRITVIVSMLLFSGILNSCGPKLESSTVLQDTSCAPPCWHQIMPGTTTKQEVQTILSSLPEVDSDSIRFIDTDNIYWESNSNTGDYGGRITFVGDQVSVINFLHKNGALTVEDAVNIFGDPEKILARFRKGERTWLSVYLFYPDQGITLLFTKVPFIAGTPARIKPDQTIDATWYFDLNLFETIMTSGPIDRLRPEVLEQAVQPWSGFGEITYIEDDQK